MTDPRLVLRTVPRLLGGASLLLALAGGPACKVSIGTAPEGTTTPEPSGPAEPIRPPATDPKIDAARMLGDLEYLASDALAGRFTHSEHLGVAADHLAAQYVAAGIAPVLEGYRVPFMAPDGFEASDELVIWVEDGKGGTRQVAGEVITTLHNGGGEAAYAEAVGVRRLGSAAAGTVKGKIVVANAPAAERLIEEVKALAEHGPAGLVLLGEPGVLPPASERVKAELAEYAIPIGWVDTKAAADWMGITAKKGSAPVVPKKAKLSMAAKRESVEREAFNVVAYIPGETTPEEIVVLGAHYDHIGTTNRGLACREQGGDTICNGADDNGSGTAMVLEVARSFADAHVRPARTVVFAHFAGEELGLHGSKALASEPPEAAPFEGGTVVAMVNLDMVGRLGDEEGLAIGGLSSSDAWMPLLDELGDRGLPMVYERTINARSDHASYYKKKVPVLFFFTGLHDDYHEVGDHFEKINTEAMATIAQLVADLTLELANGYAITYTEPGAGEGVTSSMPGSNDATVEKRVNQKPEACPSCEVD